MTKKITNEKFKDWWGKYKFVGLVILIGVGLLLLPTGKKTKTVEKSGQTTESLSVEETEEKMAKILSDINGVGQLKVMLTLDSGEEQELAKDNELSYNGKATSPEDYSKKSETVVVSGDDGEQAVVTKITAPVYRGALVVCQGAGKADVKLAVTQAVSALTGLSSDRITVVKCQ